MKLLLLFKRNLKKHKGSILGIFIFYLLISLSLVTALTVFTNSTQYITTEMKRLGYGEITAWVNQNEHLDEMVQSLDNIDAIEDIKTQPIIFAGYSINEKHSDNDGQLIPYMASEYDYKLIDQNFNAMKDISINKGEIYISPAMHSIYPLKIGDQIEFDIARTKEPVIFTIKGYFEDPFMGSSMIDMKGFLINDQDFLELSQSILNTTDFNALASNGVMMHIFQESDSSLTVTELNRVINQNTDLGKYTQFVYTQSSIYGFMMILQNIFTGFLVVFAFVLLGVSLLVTGYMISHSIELERKDMGILKTIGYTSKDLRKIQVGYHGIGAIGGMLIALAVSFLLSRYVSFLMVTSTGLRIPTKIPYWQCQLVYFILLGVLIAYIVFKTRKIVKIRPIQTIEENESRLTFIQRKWCPIHPNRCVFSLSLRQWLSGKKRYIGTFFISAILIFFVSVVGKINTWLGPNGEGLMDAFSAADHDLGIQPMIDMDMNEMDTFISSYSAIENTYELAMQNVRIEGVDYTANIISDPAQFHMIQGQTVRSDHEIVITEYIAANLGVHIGDEVNIQYESQNAVYKIVGIYQCANELGANIGMSRSGYLRIGQENPYIWCRHYILSDSFMNNQIMSELQQRYPLELAVHTNSWSGLDGIVSSMHLLTIGMYSIVILFIFITVILTGSKMLHSEQKDMAVLKSIGYTTSQLRYSFSLRFGLTAMTGAVIGTLFSILFADILITGLIALFGIGEFHSQVSLIGRIVPTVSIVFIFMIFAYLSSYKMKKIALTELIKGDE